MSRSHHDPVGAAPSDSPPRASIGMPVFNGGAFVADALRSILSQSFTNFELLISDNHSTDSTELICRGFAERDPRVTYFRQNRNIGVEANFQNVLSRARGDCFMWAAADDVWSPEYLEQAVSALDANPDVGFTFPPFRLSSISLRLTVRRSATPFSCIESCDRRNRVIGFANLHHASHKCNLVYSLFRTHLIRAALRQQAISNDGLLSMVVLGMSRGLVLPGHSFQKRYPRLWPGLWQTCLPSAARSLLPRRSPIMAKALNDASHLCCIHFPEFVREIRMISEHYAEHQWLDGFKIVAPSLLNLAEHRHG